MSRPVVILSNRGPLSFGRSNAGALVAKRGAGGLVSGLAPLVAGTDATWLAAAMSDADRAAAAQGVVEAAGLRVRLLDIDAETHRLAYDVVCNATLWFCFHGLFDRARSPVIDTRWRAAWQAYRDVNAAFVDAAADAAPEGAAVLVQDYHLALVGRALAARRPDVRAVYFSHTPFCVADGLRVLPDEIVVELLEGISGHHAVGFHTRRWADAFEDCCRAYLGPARAATTFVSPLGADPDDLGATAASDACAAERAVLAREVGDRKLLVRVDRIELSKNVLRGLLAYDDLLERHPEWRERVVFAALLYPSREGLEAYALYRDDVAALVAKLNDRWSTPTWEPILFDPEDNYPRSVAALQLADTVLINPISDGLNLVAKEQALLARDAVLVLSTEAGVWDELRDAGALGVNPFDVSATADALHAALSMPADERRARHESMRTAALARTPRHWLADHLTAAG